MRSASSLTEAVKQVAAAQTTSLTDAVKAAARSESESTVIEFPRATLDGPHRAPIVRLVASAPHADAPPRAPSDEPLPETAPDMQRASRPPARAVRTLARTARRPRLPMLRSLVRNALSRCRTALRNLIRAVTRAGLKAIAVLLLCFLSMAVMPSRVASDRPPGAQLEHAALAGRSHVNPNADASAAVRPGSDARAREAAEAWKAAKDTRSFPVLKAFIARYGDTFYAELARARMAELRKSSRSLGR